MDEVNIHVPQTIEARAEYQSLIAIENNFCSGQSSRPIMGVVQDSLLGSYLMTQGWVKIERGRFFDICVCAELDITRFEQISKTYKVFYPDVVSEDQLYHPYLFTGRGLLSMVFTSTFQYTLNNKAYKTEPQLKIRNGVIVEGSLDKSAIGPKAGAVHHYMSSKDALDFLTKIQRIANNWIRDEGYSVGVIDCIPPVYDKETGMIPEAVEQIAKCYTRAQIAQDTQCNKTVAEIQVTMALNDARSMGQKIAMEHLQQNRFLPFVYSGSKGSLNNVTQIVAALGQQSIDGERLEKTCIGNDRTFPHYDPESWTIEQQYESLGFVRHSFGMGLNPHEMFSHAAGSRVGIVATTTITGDVGYMQRRITTFMMNTTILEDRTVRDTTTKRIIQFVYGGDGISPIKQHRMNDTLGIHITTGIEALNTEYEMECEIQDADVNSAGLTIDTSLEFEEVIELSPLNSVGSGSGNNTPNSVGSGGSFDFDFD